MGVYDRQIATAKRLIAKFGQLVQWRVPAATTDPERPWIVTPGTPVDYDATIAFLPLDRQFQELIRHLKGGDVAIGSLYGLMPAVDFEPALPHQVVRGNRLYRIRSIDPLAPNGEVILYTIEFDA